MRGGIGLELYTAQMALYKAKVDQASAAIQMAAGMRPLTPIEVAVKAGDIKVALTDTPLDVNQLMQFRNEVLLSGAWFELTYDGELIGFPRMHTSVTLDGEGRLCWPANSIKWVGISAFTVDGARIYTHEYLTARYHTFQFSKRNLTSGNYLCLNGPIKLELGLS